MRSLFLISEGKLFQILLPSYRIDRCEADFLNRGTIKLLPVLNLVEIFLWVSARGQTKIIMKSAR